MPQPNFSLGRAWIRFVCGGGPVCSLCNHALTAESFEMAQRGLSLRG